MPLDRDRPRKSESDSEDITEPKGDPEMAPIYLKRLLPVFCSTFQATMLPSVRKASLGLIKKMIHCIQSNVLQELCGSESSNNNFTTQFVEVIATVLNNEVSIMRFYYYSWFMCNFFVIRRTRIAIW